MKRSLIAIVMTSVLLVGMFAGAGTSVRAATVIGPQNVSHDGEQSILPRVAQDPDGNVHVVWDEEGDRRVVYAKGTWNGSAYDFGPKYVVTEIDDGFRFATPNVAVAPNGTIMVTWSTADGAFAQVWDSRAAGPGNAPVQVGEGIQSAIAADFDSRFHVVFNGDFLIQYCLFDGSGGCARYDVFGAGDTNNNPDIVADTNGAVHIVWHTGSSGVQYIVRAKDQDWGAITRLDGGNFATIGADGQGYVHIAWSRDFNVQYCRKTAANICEERRELSTGDDIRPSIGATPAGDVLLVYLDNQSKTLQYITRENDSWSDPGVLINTNTRPMCPAAPMSGARRRPGAATTISSCRHSTLPRRRRPFRPRPFRRRRPHCPRMRAVSPKRATASLAASASSGRATAAWRCSATRSAFRLA